MDKIMKFINTIIKDAKIKLRKKNGDTDNEPDEEPQGMDEDDENPGNTTLTDGAKDKTAGINKKMVKNKNKIKNENRGKINVINVY